MNRYGTGWGLDQSFVTRVGRMCQQHGVCVVGWYLMDCVGGVWEGCGSWGGSMCVWVDGGRGWDGKG